MVMSYDYIKNLLQLSLNFNTSSISHSFSIDEENQLTVRCITGTFILEVTSSKDRQIDYYTSIDQAAETLYKKINTL